MAKNGDSSSARKAADAKVAEIRARKWGLTNLKPPKFRLALAAGVLLVLGAIVIYAQLTITAVTDPIEFIGMSYAMHTSSNEFGTTTASEVAGIAGPSIVMFLVGWLLIAIADISRRRPRAISTGALLILSAASLVCFLAVVPLQFMTGVLPGSPNFDGVRTMLTPPAIVFALGTLAPIVWLGIRRIRSRALA
ncbi:hypothetical protein [Lacisediminihabitans sp. H27-G8]|uniref:hypothetical protein n=1 Tax=Lacisediminihabitans sp. H27-G8 TaxID=3111909 RepID=UPI0038FD3678